MKLLKIIRTEGDLYQRGRRAGPSNTKFIFELDDGSAIESSIFRQKCREWVGEEFHVCLSSQAGCRFNCMFCSSGKSGFLRDLTTEEIVGQLHHILKSTGLAKVDQIQFMGIGEPLDNLLNVLSSIEEVFPKYTTKIGLSTCGLCDSLSTLLEFHPQIDLLFVSLHAVFDEKRTLIMPVNQKFGVAATIASAISFSSHYPKSIVFLNYLVFPGFNDSFSDAGMIASYLSNSDHRVRLMLSKPTAKIMDFLPATDHELYAFKGKILTCNYRNEIFVCQSTATEVAAGCGQFVFRSKYPVVSLGPTPHRFV